MGMIVVKDPYVLKVIEDEDAINPRVDCDNFGKMVCFHRRYNLGDEHHYPNKDEFLFDLLTDTMGSSDKAERFLCQVERKAEDVQHQYGGYGRAVDSMLLAEIAKKHVVLPLYLFDHSGITMNTTGFSCPWDSGQVGWIYASKEDVLKEYGGKLLTRGKRDKAEKLMRAEVSYYDSYLRGECYGFELHKGDEQLDSCWGFIGDREEIIDAVKSCLPQELAGLADSLEYDDEDNPSVAQLLADAREAAQAAHCKPAKTPQMAR